jgi:hypothetical protein
MFRLTTTTTQKVGFSRGRVSTRSSEATTITGSRSEATWSEAAGRSSRFSFFPDSRPKTRCFSQSRHLQLSVSFIQFFWRDFDSVQLKKLYFYPKLWSWNLLANLYQSPLSHVGWNIPITAFAPCVDPNEWCMKNSLLSGEFEPKTSLFWVPWISH